MTQVLTAGLQLAADKKVLVDPHPAWGGVWVAVGAAALFLIFATWIVIQRVRNGRNGDDDQQ